MKKILLSFLLLSCVFSYSQTLVPDNSFGDNGTARFSRNEFYPNRGLLVNNNYFFMSTQSIGKINYNGQIVTGFGTNGFLNLNIPNETVTLTNFVFENNYFYIYGKIKNNSTANENMYIAKIDPNGNFDSSFGTNGIFKTDLGANESISSVVVESDGGLYCVGSKYSPSKMIHFKVNPNGTLNTAFSPNGYKEINSSFSTLGASIIRYNNGYLLIGTIAIPANNTTHPEMIIVNVNGDGNVQTNFGNSGIKQVKFNSSEYFFTANINDIQFTDNKLFVNYEYAFSSNYMGSNLLIYNLENNITVYNENQSQNFYFIVDSSIYTTEFCPRCCFMSMCTSSYNLNKKNLDGTAEVSFHINGSYNYSFVYSTHPWTANNGSSLSRVIIKDDNGKFLIGGYVTAPYGIQGFSLLRVEPGVLGVNDNKFKTFALYPNPFDDELNFQSDNPVKSLEIYDLTGRMLNKPISRYENGITTFSTYNITEKGTYIVKILTSEEKVIIRKVIKK